MAGSRTGAGTCAVSAPLPGQTAKFRLERRGKVVSREELLRDLTPELRKTGLLPELLGVQNYKPAEFQEKVDWMMDRGFLKDAPAYDEIVRGK